MSKSDFDLKYQNEKIESRIVAALERISQTFRVMLWEESKNFSLSPIQIQVLIFLLYHSAEKRKVSYIADEFNMTKATISDSIKTLEQKKLVSKEFEESDTRSYVINLTKRGKEIADRVSMFSDELRMPIEKLHPDEKENLLLSLIGIINHLNKAGVITIQRMCLNCIHHKSLNKGHQHFCTLLNKTIESSDLRIDCPEHQQQIAD